MNRLEANLARVRAGEVRPLAPFLTAGDGGAEVTLAALRALDQANVTCVELGLPFSDPIADGPTIQAASDRALAAGMDLTGVCTLVRKLRRESELPVALMSYLNPLLKPGLERATGELAEAGVDALLVPDVPVEESGDLARAAHGAGLAPIFFVAPTTTDERLAAAADASRGFLYTIGRVGITGQSTELDDATLAFLDRVRAAAGELPVAVGFGLKDAQQVALVTRHADLAIVGSAFVDRLHRAVSPHEPGSAAASDAAADAARAYADELCSALP